MVQLETVLKLLGSALSIWESHQKNQFIKKYMDLKTEFYNEKNKDKVNHASLDNLEFQLQLLVDAVSSEIARSKTENMPK